MGCIVFVLPSLSLVSNWIKKIYPFWTNYRIIVLHMGALQKTRPEPIENVDFYDITYLSAKQIVGLLKVLKVQKCIFFNFRSILEQYILLICKDNDIKTVYLEHGILNRDNEHFKNIFSAKNKSLLIKRQIVFLLKYIRYVIGKRRGFLQIGKLYKIIRYNSFYLMPFDKYLIYGERCYSYLKNIYPLKAGQNVEKVGFPLFDNANQKNEALLSQLPKKEGILYVHQPFILDGYASITYEQEKKYLLEAANVLTPKFGQFTLLLHPRENLEEYKERYNDTRIEVLMSPNDYKLFINRKLVLGHYSTALLYSLFFEVPTYIIEYPTVNIQPIFEYIFKSMKIENILDDSSQDLFNRKEYLLGPVNTYEYIAQRILEV